MLSYYEKPGFIVDAEAVAYPSFYCEKAMFEKELKKNPELMEELGENYIETLNKGFDCTKLEKLSCMKPIIPSCLYLVDVKSDAGKREAAKILLNGDKYNRIPKDVLTDNGSIRIDLERFTDFLRVMEERGVDYSFGELFGDSSCWSYNCYVRWGSTEEDDYGELPVIMVYYGVKEPVKMWYIGTEDDGLMYFMYSTVNIQNILNK